MREISRSVTGKYKPGIPLNILKGGRGSGGHPLIFHCHCWNVLANCFHGNNFFFSTSLLLLVVVKDEIQFNLACLQVHEGHNRDLKKKMPKCTVSWIGTLRSESVDLFPSYSLDFSCLSVSLTASLFMGVKAQRSCHGTRQTAVLS